MCKIIKAVIPWGWISSYQNSPSLIFFKAISSFFDTTSGTMNTDDHLFIYLSNCLSQTQPDGVFQNQINFRLIHSGPTPVPWLLALRHQPNWWEVVNWKECRFLSIEGGHMTQGCGCSPYSESDPFEYRKLLREGPANISETKASSKNFLFDFKE